MKRYLLVTGVLSRGLLTTVSGPALAHHGNAAYADQITEFKQATVTKFASANPHTLINFDATDTQGKVVHMVGARDVLHPSEGIEYRDSLARPSGIQIP